MVVSGDRPWQAEPWLRLVRIAMPDGTEQKLGCPTEQKQCLRGTQCLQRPSSDPKASLHISGTQQKLPRTEPARETVLGEEFQVPVSKCDTWWVVAESGCVCEHMGDTH